MKPQKKTLNPFLFFILIDVIFSTSYTLKFTIVLNLIKFFPSCIKKLSQFSQLSQTNLIKSNILKYNPTWYTSNGKKILLKQHQGLGNILFLKEKCYFHMLNTSSLAYNKTYEKNCKHVPCQVLYEGLKSVPLFLLFKMYVYPQLSNSDLPQNSNL